MHKYILYFSYSLFFPDFPYLATFNTTLNHYSHIQTHKMSFSHSPLLCLYQSIFNAHIYDLHPYMQYSYLYHLPLLCFFSKSLKTLSTSFLSCSLCLSISLQIYLTSSFWTISFFFILSEYLFLSHSFSPQLSVVLTNYSFNLFFHADQFFYFPSHIP